MNNLIEINILGRDYKISCPPGEEQSLQNSVNFLQTKIEEFQRNGVTGVDRILVMTALNIAHDLLNQNPMKINQVSNPDYKNKLNFLSDLIDQTINS